MTAKAVNVSPLLSRAWGRHYQRANSGITRLRNEFLTSHCQWEEQMMR